jgi:hypothetical protein
MEFSPETVQACKERRAFSPRTFAMLWHRRIPLELTRFRRALQPEPHLRQGRILLRDLVRNCNRLEVTEAIEVNRPNLGTR